MAVYENTLFAKLHRRRLEISIPLNGETERPTQFLELIDVEVAELTLQPANQAEAFVSLGVALGDVPRLVGIRCEELYESYGFITETIL